MKKIQLMIIGIFLATVVFGQGNWELIYEQEGNGGLLISNLSSSGVEYDVFVSGSRKNSFLAFHVSKVNQWTKDHKWAQGFLNLPINSKSDPVDIFMLDENDIWVCGYWGMISHSGDHGYAGTWDVQPTPDDLILKSIWFTDKNNGWAVGYAAAVLHTTNGGESWNKVEVPVDRFFSRVFFTDKNNGYILATKGDSNYHGYVLKTSNGGASWSVHKFETNSQMNLGMFFYDSQNGWICGDKGFITHTSDGGKTWTKQQWIHSDKWQLNDIHFVSLNEGWTCGDRGELYHTTDGGDNWTKIDIGEKRGFTAIEFNGPYLGWLSTSRKIYQYKDDRFEKYQQDYKKNRSANSKTTEIIPVPIPHQEESKTKTSDLFNTAEKVSSNSIFKGNSWEIRSYQNTSHNIEQACKEIQNQGGMPAGLNIMGDKIEVLIINKQPFQCYDWTLMTYQDVKGLSDGISNMIESGSMPLAMSLVDKDFKVLYAKTSYVVHGWQIMESELDIQDVSNDIQPYLKDGYIPVGISLFADYYYTLLIQPNEFPVNNWSLQGYNCIPETQLKNGINKEVSNDMLPFGFFKNEDLINVLYLGF